MYATHLTMVILSGAKWSITMSKDIKAEAWTLNHVINPINLTLRSKVKVVSGSWMYLTHSLMMIDPCAKDGMLMSKLTEVTGRTWQKPVNLTLRSKVNIESGSWMYTTHCLMVIHPSAKYGKPMSNQNQRPMGHIAHLIKQTHMIIS